jgi:hypothetical protein
VILRVIVPEYRTREVIIKASGQREDLTKRSLVQIIEAINRALGNSSIIIARHFPSNNIILIFEKNTKVEEYTKEIAWI